MTVKSCVVCFWVDKGLSWAEIRKNYFENLKVCKKHEDELKKEK